MDRYSDDHDTNSSLASSAIWFDWNRFDRNGMVDPERPAEKGS